MREFQKDHTTPEQSKLLLNLGVPADSADCCYHDYPRYNGEFNGRDKKPTILWEDEPISKLKSYSKLSILPCWSALRLMEIIDICALGENSDPNTEEYPSTIKVMNKLHIPYVEYLVKSIERAVQLGTIDFSKLDIQ